MTTKVKKKKDYQVTEKQQKFWDKVNKQRDEIGENLKKKDYVLTVYETGCESFSTGDHTRQIPINRFYVVCSLEEIPDYIKKMTSSFWTHEEGLTEKEIKNYPFEKKKWGKYRNVIIEPLSEEMEKNYLSASKEGFFETWRMIQEGEKE